VGELERFRDAHAPLDALLEGEVVGRQLAHQLEALARSIDGEVVSGVVGLLRPPEQQLRRVAVRRISVRHTRPVMRHTQHTQHNTQAVENVRDVGDLAAGEKNAVDALEQIPQLLLFCVVADRGSQEFV
jgi:hypothetical protein